MAKTILAVKNEPRCTICGSGRRAEFDSYLVRYLNGEPEPASGKTLTHVRLAEIGRILTGGELSKTAVRRHLENHCRVLGDAEAEKVSEQERKTEDERDELLAEIDELLEDRHVNPSGLLDLHMRAHLLDLRRSILSGQPVRLTADQAQRAADRLIAAQRQRQEGELLGLLTTGIEMALRGSLPSSPAGELEAPQVVEGEVLDEDEDDAA